MTTPERRRLFPRLAALFVSAAIAIGASATASAPAQATGVCGNVETWPTIRAPVVAWCTVDNHPRCFPGHGGNIFWIASYFVCVTPP